MKITKCYWEYHMSMEAKRLWLKLSSQPFAVSLSSKLIQHKNILEQIFQQCLLHIIKM